MLRITPLERQALRLLATGGAAPDVAAGLGLSQLESESLLARLFAEMGAGTTAEAVSSAHRRGLLTSPVRGQD